jgi:hypothetical protein
LHYLVVDAVVKLVQALVASHAFGEEGSGNESTQIILFRLWKQKEVLGVQKVVAFH